MVNTEQGAADPDSARSALLTVSQLSQLAGMSARNIRAHQARGLLPAPIRRGRTAYYNEDHLRRLETIHGLQQQGYNLVAIAAILGVRDRPDADDLAPVLDWLRLHQPALAQALRKHRIVVKGDDGRLKIVRPRALRASLSLNQAGVRAVPAIHLLAETLDRVSLIADEIIIEAGSQVVTLVANASGEDSIGDLDEASSALTERTTALLVEAFRVAVENRGKDILPDLVAQRVGGELTRRTVPTTDYN